MKYRPINKTAEEILRTLGYSDKCNRGWIMERIGKSKSGTSRLHAMIELDGTIDLHRDTLEEGKHISHKGFLEPFIKMFEDIDNGIIPEVRGRTANKYSFKNIKSGRILDYHVYR